MIVMNKERTTLKKVFPAHHSLDIKPEILIRMREAFRNLKADGKLLLMSSDMIPVNMRGYCRNGFIGKLQHFLIRRCETDNGETVYKIITVYCKE